MFHKFLNSNTTLAKLPTSRVTTQNNHVSMSIYAVFKLACLSGVPKHDPKNKSVRHQNQTLYQSNPPSLQRDSGYANCVTSVTMNSIFLFILFTVFAHVCFAQNLPLAEPGPSIKPPATSSASSAHSSYRLGAGDVVNIRVFGEEDLSKEKIKLTDAGTVSYPVLGELRVLGLTVGDLERLITDGLRGRYLVNPRVSVQIEEYRPFYINGMVEKPGGYPYQPGLTVRKAASIAGGFRERASSSKMYVIRENDPTNKHEKVNMNTPINPGDIITVEESFF